MGGVSVTDREWPTRNAVLAEGPKSNKIAKCDLILFLMSLNTPAILRLTRGKYLNFIFSPKTFHGLTHGGFAWFRCSLPNRSWQAPKFASTSARWGFLRLGKLPFKKWKIFQELPGAPIFWMWRSGALFHFGGTCMSSGQLPMGQRGWWTEWSFSLQGVSRELYFFP